MRRKRAYRHTLQQLFDSLQSLQQQAPIGHLSNIVKGIQEAMAREEEEDL